MKLLTIKTDEGLQLGVKTDKGVLPVDLSLEELLADTNKRQELRQQVDRAMENGDRQQFLDEEELVVGPSVPSPGKIVCVGLNYRKHAEESGMPIPDYPILFNKFNNAVAAHGETIELPQEAAQVDYEAELVIVIGKTAKRIAKEEAGDYIFGYCAGNDLSARDLQFRTNQWLLGKSLDGFSPIGPYLVTADEVGDPNQLSIRSYVNGELRQNSNTSDMIFDVHELVSYISRYMTMQPGDLILTGTPEGVILGYPKEKQVWLQDGDEVTVEIEKLGRLTNRMKREAG